MQGKVKNLSLGKRYNLKLVVVVVANYQNLERGKIQ